MKQPELKKGTGFYLFASLPMFRSRVCSVNSATLHASRTTSKASSAVTPVGRVRPWPTPCRLRSVLTWSAIAQEFWKMARTLAAPGRSAGTCCGRMESRSGHRHIEIEAVTKRCKQCIEGRGEFAATLRTGPIAGGLLDLHFCPERVVLYTGPANPMFARRPSSLVHVFQLPFRSAHLASITKQPWPPEHDGSSYGFPGSRIIRG